jgi:flavin-binding protein dodecin
MPVIALQHVIRYFRKVNWLSILKRIIMAILKVLELMSNSNKSWEDAAQQAVNEASKTLKHIRSVYVQDHSAVVKNNKIVEYRATVKLTFELEEEKKK